MVKGDMLRAEDLDGYPDHSTPALVLGAREDEDLAKHVMAIAKESRDQSAEVTRGIQARGVDRLEPVTEEGGGFFVETRAKDVADGVRPGFTQLTTELRSSVTQVLPVSAPTSPA